MSELLSLSQLLDEQKISQRRLYLSAKTYDLAETVISIKIPRLVRTVYTELASVSINQSGVSRKTKLRNKCMYIYRKLIKAD